MIADLNAEVGYQVTITREEWCATMDSGIEWKVCVQRLSDGATIERVFAWRWTARRFGRSARRISREFAAIEAYRDTAVERFVVVTETMKGLQP